MSGKPVLILSSSTTENDNIPGITQPFDEVQNRIEKKKNTKKKKKKNPRTTRCRQSIKR